MKKYYSGALLMLVLGFLLPIVLEIAGTARTASLGAGNRRNALTPSREFQLIFPQAANGSGIGLVYRSSIILLNNTGRNAEGTISFFGNDGSPLVLGTSIGRESSFEFALASGQILKVETDGLGDLVTGWTRVTSNAPLSGAGTFILTDASGNFLSEAGIGDSKPATRLMIFADTTQDRNTAFAVCNPDTARAASARFELRTLSGTVLAESTATLAPLAHRAEYFTETFKQMDTRSFRGVLTISADIPLSVIALRSHGIHYTSLPAVPAAAGQPSEALIFPRIGDGLFGDSRFQTTFLVLNNSAAVQTATLELFQSDGSEMLVEIGSERSGRYAFDVPAFGGIELVTGGRSDPGVVGWARVICDNPLGGGASFSIAEKATGGFVSEVGIPGSEKASRRLAYVYEKEGSYTGLALSNASGEELTARLRLFSGAAAGQDQAPVAETTLALPARGGMGRFIYELFPGVPEIAANNFEGRLEISSWIGRFGEDIPSPLAGLTLLGHGAKFSSLPMAPEQRDSHSLSDFDPGANELLSQMTLEEKIGQMTQAERGSLEPGDIGFYYLGSILSGGGSGPAANNVEAWADMYNDFQSLALLNRLKIPILYGIDAVHGHNNVRGAVIFPHNIGLGATRNADLVTMAARITACEVRATGINWTFSPVVAVPRDDRWGRTYEGFGEDPDLVRQMGRAAVLGYQGSSLSDPSSIIACAKHYLGDGGTSWGTGAPIDQGDTRVDEATLRRVHLPGYLGAIDAGVGTIMVSFSSWNGQKMTGNRYLLTDLLKGELGFEGFLITDWGAIDQLPGNSYHEKVKAAINAGIDMGMIPYKHQEFFSTLKSLAQSGEVSISRIDDAVRRILRVKFAAGLFDSSPLTDRSYQSRFGSREHREVARETVRQSVVLLKNQRSLLPLSKSLRSIVVAGTNADDLGHQCGGWTMTWQGGTGAITPGTTILQAILQTVSPGTLVRYSPDGSGAAGADVAIVVIGESSYAEGPGDSATLILSSKDIAAINSVKQAGIPMVVILISGRPLILDSVLDSADALLAAWLPGTEGQGVADVIFGDYKPTGKLPCSWPRNITQIPINLGDPSYDPLFPFGFGLSY